MKKWIILILIMLLMFQIVNALKDCTGIMNPSEIPCTLFGSWSPSNECGSYEAKFYNESPVLLDTRNLDNYSIIGLCNATFNYSKVGSYYINFTYGDTMRVNVEGRPEMEIALIIGLGIIISICLVLTIVAKQIWLKMIFFFPMLGLLLLEINTIKLMAESNNMNSGIISMLSVTYTSLVWIVLFLCFMAFIVGIVKVFNIMKDTRDMKKDRGTHDIKFE